MDLEINKIKIQEETGIKEMEDIDYLFYILANIDWLLAHNKNYTKEQYKRLLDIQSILMNIE